MKLGFCLIGHQAHVRHILPIAVSCNEIENVEVEVIITNALVRDEIDRVLKSYGNPKINVKMLNPTLFRRMTKRLKGKLYSNNASVIRRNRQYFLGFDALITAHHNLDYVMKLDRKRRIKYVCTMHGAGDGPVGFDSRFSEYDLLMAAGEELDTRFKEAGLVNENNRAIVSGYVKFDTVDISEKIKFFNNGNLTVVYNPHHEKSISSWWIDGVRILDWFSRRPDINLIFAPHIKVLNGFVPKYLESYQRFANILIDVNSENLYNCRYTQSADIYLGDLSSQVYEFLGIKCRPCLFINSNGVDWHDNDYYKCWSMGEVLTSVSELGDALESAFKKHRAYYAEIQSKLVSHKFFTPPSNQTASDYAAQRLISYLRESH